jgi:hypothetical protein
MGSPGVGKRDFLESLSTAFLGSVAKVKNLYEMGGRGLGVPLERLGAFGKRGKSCSLSPFPFPLSPFSPSPYFCKKSTPFDRFDSGGRGLIGTVK